MRTSLRSPAALLTIASIAVLLFPAEWVVPSLANTPSVSDLALSADAPVSVDRGTVFTDSFLITNNGPADATMVVLTLKPGLGLQFQAAGGNATCTVEGETVKCAVPGVPLKSSVSVPVAFKTMYQDQCTELSYTMEASVAAYEMDPSIVDNNKLISTAIRCVSAPSECSDGIDNDHDGLLDVLDPGCLVGTAEGMDELNSQSQRDQERQQMRILSRQRQVQPVAPVLPTPPILPVPTPSPAPIHTGCGDACLGQDVTVSLSAMRGEMIPGDTQTLQVHVRNSSFQILSGVEVDVRFDPAQLQGIAPAGTLSSPGQISWFITLMPGETKTLPFSVKANTGVPQGTSAKVSTIVLGVKGSPADALFIPVLSELPQTGVAFLSPSLLLFGMKAISVFALILAAKFSLAGGLLACAFSIRKK
jgi:hypothetical protein